MVVSTVTLDRERILAHRRRVGALDRRLPSEPASTLRAAVAGLQDSVPRAAVLSLHARVEHVGPDDWDGPGLTQVWGPRFAAYVVAETDVAAFTIGRLPVASAARRRAEDTADRLDRFLEGRTMTYRAAGEALGIDPNALRYAAPTGRLRLRWEGSGPPLIWTVDPPDVPESDARRDLARRYLHVFGPGTSDGFARWAGVKPAPAAAVFETMVDELVAVETPIGPAWMLPDDVDAVRRSDHDPPAPARLLPSGDAYSLYWGDARSVLVTDHDHRGRLWTSRVWPGAILVDGEIVGTWRRAGDLVELSAWRRLRTSQRTAVEVEAASLPIPGGHDTVRTRWIDP